MIFKRYCRKCDKLFRPPRYHNGVICPECKMKSTQHRLEGIMELKMMEANQ